MAVENAENDKVKEFAQTLVSEHEKLCRDIEKLQAAGGHMKNSDHSKTNEQSTDQSAADANRPNQNRQNQQGQTARRDARKTQDGNWASNNQGIVGKLQMINEKASKKQLEMAKQMLQEHKGKDFDMAFVGMQIASHTRAVAELSALEGVGSKEMQDVVKKAEEATSKHLEKAKGLAEELSSK
jgi:predicted outer membrane protein